MENIRAVLVEDEDLAVQNLRLKIANNCPHVDVVAAYRTYDEALRGIQQEQPQVVFLDIGLDTHSGFDLLKRLQHVHFEVIFTSTSREHVHTTEAIRVEAVDYLSKPFTDEELVGAVARATARIRRNTPPPPQFPRSLTIKSVGKDTFVPIDEITYCRASNNLTEVYVHQEKRFILVSETLKAVQEKLPPQQFFRIHKSSLVNRDFVRAVKRTTGLAVLLHDGQELRIAQDRAEAFYKWMDE